MVAFAGLTRSVASNYAGFAVRSAVALLLTPFLARELGAAAFGAWILLGAILEYFHLAEFGISPAIVRQVSLHRSRGERERVDAAVSAGMALLLALSLLSLPLIQALAAFGPRWFGLDPPTARDFAGLAWLLGAAAILSYFMRLLHAVIEGHQRFDLLNLSGITGSVLGAVASVWVVLRGAGLSGLLLVLVAQVAWRTIFEGWIAWRRFGVRPGWRHVRPSSLRSVLDYARYAFLIDLALSLAWRIDLLIVGIFLPVSQVAYYAVGTRVAGALTRVVEPLLDTFLPLASTLHAAGDEASLRRLLLDGSRATMLLIAPALVLLARHGELLIELWIGPEYARASRSVLLVFLAVVLAGVLYATSSRVLLGLGRVRFEAGVTLAGALANLALSLLLVRGHGVVGVALGTLIPTAIVGLGVGLPYSCRMVGTSARHLLAHALGPAVGLIAAAAAGMALTARLLAHPVAVLAADALVAAGLLLFILPRVIDLRGALAAGRAVQR